jgi:NitT/TauT family transport system permease protein
MAIKGVRVSRSVADRIGLVTAQIAFAVLFVLLWQWASDSRHINDFFFGRPSDVGHQIGDWISSGDLWRETGSTVELLIIGYLAGLAIGFAIGSLMGASRTAHEICEPFIIFLNSVPRIILYPFFVVWLGFGQLPRDITVVLVMIPIVSINIAAGMKTVQGHYLANLRAQGASRVEVARHVYLPSLSLWVLSTCRVTFGLAFQAAISAELITSTGGLGHLAAVGESLYNVNIVYAVLVVVTVLAVVVDFGLSAVERRATRWLPRPS